MPVRVVSKVFAAYGVPSLQDVPSTQGPGNSSGSIVTGATRAFYIFTVARESPRGSSGTGKSTLLLNPIIQAEVLPKRPGFWVPATRASWFMTAGASAGAFLSYPSKLVSASDPPLERNGRNRLSPEERY